MSLYPSLVLDYKVLFVCAGDEIEFAVRKRVNVLEVHAPRIAFIT